MILNKGAFLTTYHSCTVNSLIPYGHFTSNRPLMPTRPSGVVASRPHDAKCMPDSCTYKMCPLVVIILYFLTCRYLPYALNYRCCTKLLNVTSTVSKCTYARSCRYKKKYFIKLLTSFLCSAVNCFLASSS